jgi:hypothetical protein
MLTLFGPIGVSDSLLGEVARTEWLVDPVLLCWAALLIVTVLVCTVVYFVFGRTFRLRMGAPEAV